MFFCLLAAASGPGCSSSKHARKWSYFSRAFKTPVVEVMALSPAETSRSDIRLIEGTLRKISKFEGNSRGIKFEISAADETLYRLAIHPLDPALNMFEKGEFVTVEISLSSESGALRSMAMSSAENSKIILIDLSGEINLKDYSVSFGITPSSETSYIESGRWENYCFAAYRHDAIVIEEGDKTFFLNPGETKQINKDGFSYSVINIDNASLDMSECGDTAGRSTGFVVVGFKQTAIE